MHSSRNLGSGGSAGREGPIAQIGASFGSLIGQIFRLGSKDLKLLTVCGVAIGIAGTFNAPMGGAIFSMEVVSRRFFSNDAVPILLSSVVAKAVVSELINPVPDFIDPAPSSSTLPTSRCAFFWVHYSAFGLSLGQKLLPHRGLFQLAAHARQV